MTTATKDIDAQIVWVDLNIGFFGLGQNRYGNGTSVDTTLTLGGWDTLDTVDTPGRVLMISKAGRMVCAVVWAAPETIPSARPVCTIIVPK